MKIRSIRNFFALILALINSIVLTKLFADSYNMVYSNNELLISALITTIVVSMVPVFIFLLIEKRHFILLLALLFILTPAIIQLVKNAPQALQEVNFLNMNLEVGNILKAKDYSWLFIYFTGLISLVTMLSFYIFPYNILLIDLIMFMFLFGVDYSSGISKNIASFAVIWSSIILLHRHFDYGEIKKSKFKSESIKNLKVKLIRLISLGLIVSIVSSLLVFSRSGLYSERIHAYLSDILTEEKGGKLELKDSFDLSYVGYPVTSHELGGNIELKDREMMLVNGDIPKYFKGNVYHKFLNNLWEKDPESYYSYRDSIDDKSNETFKDYGVVSDKRVTISHLNLIVSSFFTPYYTEKITPFSARRIEKVYYSESEKQFLSNFTINYKYQAQFFDSLDVNALYFQEKFKSTNFEEMNKEEIDAYRKRHSRDLELPEINPEIRKLAQRITEGKKTNLEKAISIRDYLKNNYEYTLTPNDKNVGDEFLPNFLFNTKKGYCVHFATAFTILLRCVDVPARYVEGFMNSNEVLTDGDIMLRDKDAHAWTEVLVSDDKDHWMYLDATASARLQAQANPALEEKEKEKEETKTITSTEKKQTKVEENKAKDEEQNNTSSTVENKRSSLMISFFLFPLALILTLVILIIFHNIKIRKMIGKKDAGSFIEYVFRTLSNEGYKFDISETSLEKSSKIRNNELRDSMIKMVSLNYGYLYSGARISSDFSLRQLVYSQLLLEIKSTLPYYKYLLIKYFK